MQVDFWLDFCSSQPRFYVTKVPTSKRLGFNRELLAVELRSKRRFWKLQVVKIMTCSQKCVSEIFWVRFLAIFEHAFRTAGHELRASSRASESIRVYLSRYQKLGWCWIKSAEMDAEMDGWMDGWCYWQYVAVLGLGWRKQDRLQHAFFEVFGLIRNVTCTTWQPGSFCATLFNQFFINISTHTTSFDNLDFKLETSLDLSVMDLFKAEFDWVQLPEFVSWILEAVNLNPNICQTEIPKTSRFLDFLADASPAFSSAAPIERLVSFSWEDKWPFELSKIVWNGVSSMIFTCVLVFWMCVDRKMQDVSCHSWCSVVCKWRKRDHRRNALGKLRRVEHPTTQNHHILS